VQACGHPVLLLLQRCVCGAVLPVYRRGAGAQMDKRALCPSARDGPDEGSSTSDRHRGTHAHFCPLISLLCNRNGCGEHGRCAGHGGGGGSAAPAPRACALARRDQQHRRAARTARRATRTQDRRSGRRRWTRWWARSARVSARALHVFPDPGEPAQRWRRSITAPGALLAQYHPCSHQRHVGWRERPQ
jgi:hypothetical protein